MPRNRIAIWAALLAWPSLCSAQTVGAITDYLKPIVSKIAGDPNAGGWTWETNGNGGYLLRMAMDVTGDGIPEQFVTSSLTAVKQVAEWRVFDVNTSGEMRPYARSIRLPADSVWPASNENASSLIYVAAPDRERELASNEKPYPVHRFKFAFPEINEARVYASADEAAKLRPADPSELPKVQAILLAEYLTKPDTKWFEVSEWKLDANDCFFRPEDKERATKNTSFTPQAALSMLGLVQPSQSGNGSATTHAQQQPDIQPQTPKRTVKTQTSPPPSEEPASSTPWSVIVILIVAACGLLWLLLKRRK